MYEIGDLFDKRSVVATRLEQILAERNLTKAELCKQTGVSRPTIDKLLLGRLTNKTNFEKHISKILTFLKMSPDALFGNSVNINNKTRIIRGLRNQSLKQISKVTEISVDRLKQIEAGKNATVAELRDVAMCLSAGVKDLLGENFFETQIADLDYFINFVENENEYSGFWGHIGIMPNNSNIYSWYPITSRTRGYIYKIIENERVAIPCMNNKVLYLYMPNIKEIMLLDEACDQPDHANWDPGVSCGEIPFVVYEAFEDYEEDGNSEMLSKKFKEYLNKLIKEMAWSREDIDKMIYTSKIYYADGRIKSSDIEFNASESLVEEIANTYRAMNTEFAKKMFYYNNFDGSENFININQVSIMELPLVKLEKAIIAF